MAEILTASEIKNTVSLAELLERLGYRPAKRSGKELFFLSMLRDSDSNPSLTINEDLNVWYDHGLGMGGDVIDFGLRYWAPLSFPEVLAKINEAWQGAPRFSRISAERKHRRHAVKLPRYRIEEVKELGNNPVITEYLQNRGIWEIAQGRLNEIYYFVEDEKKRRKYFFAAGWKNELGAWEVRNKYFKGCLGHKAITLISGPSGKLSIFEGYLNYLSWLSLHPDGGANVLVLNSLSLLPGAIRIAADYGDIELFLDRDEAGHTASKAFIEAVPAAKDQSTAYAGYNDYNDFLIAQRRHSNRLFSTNSSF